MGKKAAVSILMILLTILVMNALYKIPSGEIISQTNDKITITILAGQSTTDAGTEAMMEEVLEKRFPDINFEWICVGWGDQFASQAEGKFVSGDVPDILIGKAQDVENFWKREMIVPIEGSAPSKIEEQSMKLVTKGNDVYGLPYTESFQGVFYNKEIFKKYSLDVPKTTEELEHIITVLKANGIIPFACHFQESWKVGNMTMQFFMNDIFAENPTWGDEFRQGYRSFQDNSIVKKLFLNNKYILDNSFEDAIQIDQYECDIRFAKGEAAMYLTGTWSLQGASQVVPNSQIGIFPYPNESGDAKLLVETNITFMKGNTGKHEEIVEEILDEIASDQSLAKEIVDYTHSKSTLKELRTYGEIVIQEDVNTYQQKNEVRNVMLGNTQLVWNYQNDVAKETLLWLQGKKKLNEVFVYADENRKESSLNAK